MATQTAILMATRSETHSVILMRSDSPKDSPMVIQKQMDSSSGIPKGSLTDFPKDLLTETHLDSRSATRLHSATDSVTHLETRTDSLKDSDSDSQTRPERLL